MYKMLSDEFEGLLDTAKELISTDKSAQQIIVMSTSKSNVYHFANRDIISSDVADEQSFIKMLSEKGDIKVTSIVCLWRDGTIDLPSMHLRKMLTDLDPQNLQTKILLRGANDFNIKDLKATIPPE